MLQDSCGDCGAVAGEGRWTVSAGSTWFCMIGRMALWMKYDTASMPASCPPVTGSP